MTDQTAAGLSTQSSTTIKANISSADRQILRQLDAQVAEIAARPVENDKRDLWYSHNALKATRPVIFCDPENGWNEIITQDQIKCEGEIARGWEMHLRKEIFWGTQMNDDRVVCPWFNVPHVYTESDWGMHETRIGGDHSGSYTWEAPIKTSADLEKLRFPQITVDYEATNHILDLARSTFGDLLEIRLKTSWWWSIGMTWIAVNLRGLSQFMLDMTDNPEIIHRLMAFLRDGYLAKLNYLESHDLLYLNNDGTYVGSGGFGWTNELPQAGFNGHVRTMDMWGFAESQETVGVSPRMFAEFVYPYQVPILERFGINCYGCCEPLDKRWHVVENFPRLRRISVSAWANVDKMAEMLGDRYIFSWKPNPADLAMDHFDEDRIRAYIRKTVQAAKNCRLEIIMKDNHTIGNDPDRVIRWVQIAKEEANA